MSARTLKLTVAAIAAAASLALAGPAAATPAVPTAVFDPSTTGWYSYRNLTSAQFAARFDALKRDNMVIDLEVDVIDGAYRVGAVFRANPDGRGWASLRNLTSAQFHERWEHYRDRGFRLVDQETYVHHGARQYAGVWIENREDFGWASYRGVTSARVLRAVRPLPRPRLPARRRRGRPVRERLPLRGRVGREPRVARLAPAPRPDLRPVRGRVRRPTPTTACAASTSSRSRPRPAGATPASGSRTAAGAAGTRTATSPRPSTATAGTGSPTGIPARRLREVRHDVRAALRRHLAPELLPAELAAAQRRSTRSSRPSSTSTTCRASAWPSAMTACPCTCAGSATRTSTTASGCTAARSTGSRR